MKMNSNNDKEAVNHPKVDDLQEKSKMKTKMKRSKFQDLEEEEV